jgi:glycosyltransferase involved in cell wall biosynthesis
VRVLLLPMRFPLDVGQSYLTTDLAEALLEAGHAIQVLQLDWDAEPGGPTERLTSARGIPLLRVRPRAFGKPGRLLHNASKFVLSARHVGREARRAFSLGEFDAVICWMPALAFAPVVRAAAHQRVARRILFVWDFFPDHHGEIGLVPSGPVRWIARFLEQRVLRRFTTIFCTLPANAEYLRRRFRVAADQQVRIAPVWTTLETPRTVDRAAVRGRHGLPAHAPIAVFGGQIAAGRGFELMLDAAEIAARQGSSLAFLFVGEGPLAGDLAARAQSRPNVIHRPAMSTADYRELLAACDVGMVATVPGVSSQTTPSKTLDYLKAGLPVIAAIEPGNEFAALLERRRVGRTVAFGDAAAFQREAAFLARDPAFREGLAQRTYSCLAEIFDVRLAVSAILDAAGERQEKNSSARNPALNAAWVAK